jgi:uncharacterized membrane protein YfcA
MIIEMASLVYPLLFGTGLLAGTVDAVAGGGGLISVPVLLSVGIPPHSALGTNKFQSSIGTAIATWSYHRHGLIAWRSLRLGLVVVFFGAVAGAVAAQILSGSFLKTLIPWLLLIILCYAIFAPRFGADDNPAKIPESRFYGVFGSTLGFYDGFLGPGVGSFWVFSLTHFLGFNLTKATAYTKVFNLTSNLTALFCFVVAGNVDYRVGLCMAAGQLIGGRLGAQVAIKNGAKLIRPLFLVMVTVTILVLLYRQYS